MLIASSSRDSLIEYYLKCLFGKYLPCSVFSLRICIRGAQDASLSARMDMPIRFP